MDERLAVLTGGSRGIGAATALQAPPAGWDVLLSWRSGEREAEDVARPCRATGRWAGAAHPDGTDEREVRALFTELAEAAGALRGGVNIAGGVCPRGTVAGIDAARVRRVMETNVVGAVSCSREAGRAMSP